MLKETMKKETVGVLENVKRESDDALETRKRETDSVLETTKKETVGVLGAGTWGIALARMLHETGKEVTVWSALAQEVEQLKETNKHPKLPNMKLPTGIIYTNSMEEACKDKDVIVFAVPSIFVRSTAKSAREYIRAGQIIVDVAKGIEPDTLMTLTEVIADELKDETLHLVALSGPTHAEEVAVDLPTVIVAACENEKVARYVQQFFTSSFMRVYTNTDVKGIEICGAFKNIIALATGISRGLGYGDNAKAALITRGIAEITRLGIKMDCPIETFSGLTGVGDLVVTCTSEHSRNNRAGFLIGQGYTPEEAKKKVGMVVEGINALPAAVKLIEKYDVDMPIVTAVNQVVNEGLAPIDAVDELLNRKQKTEIISEE